MSNSWINRTEEEVKEEVFQIGREETGLSSFKSTGVFRRILETIARVAWEIYRRYINAIYQNFNLDAATGIWLDLHGTLSNVIRKPGVVAAGVFSANAYAAGTIPAGTWVIVDGTRLRFRVTEAVTFAGPGLISMSVEAEKIGSAYNVVPETVLRFTRVIPGVNPEVSAADSWTTTPGDDRESDPAYRARIIDKWKSVGEGNPASRYRFIAASVPGVAQAEVVRTPRGWGSIDIIISSADGAPSQELIDRVVAEFADRRMVARDFLVRGPQEIPVNIVVEYTGNYTEAEVAVAIRTWGLELAIGGDLEIIDIYTVAIARFSFDAYEVIEPTRNVPCPAFGKIIPTVTATQRTA